MLAHGVLINTEGMLTKYEQTLNNGDIAYY